MDGLFDMRRVVGSRTCSCKTEEKEVGARRDSFLGKSPQGPLCRCGTDFQGRLLKFSGQ